MIRIEPFGELHPPSIGIEIQVWKFNLQVNAGFRLLHSYSFEMNRFKNESKSVRRPFLFAGLGPFGLTAWMDP
jgi:hypothetical protein